MKHVKVYTTGTCAYCQAEKQFLKQHNIDFEEIRVDQDVTAAEEMIDLSGQMGVPVTVITDDKNSPEYIIGFDQARLAAALGV